MRYQRIKEDWPKQTLKIRRYGSKMNIIFVGSKTKHVMSEMHKNDSVAFMEKVKRAYAACLSCLLDKLPIQNEVLKCCSAILACLQRLPDLVTNVLEDHELDDYNKQCRKCVLDQKFLRRRCMVE